MLGMRQPVDKCIFVSDRNVSGPVLQRSVSGPSELGKLGRAHAPPPPQILATRGANQFSNFSYMFVNPNIFFQFEF